ncbi:hypothetical protein [Streptomyces sp. NPDC050528]|uniref:hypothetical protein n=1 Tax=Streptomyces sp. NPDC050528 TaxID=3365623 RepID=UPI0037BBFD82
MTVDRDIDPFDLMVNLQDDGSRRGAEQMSPAESVNDLVEQFRPVAKFPHDPFTKVFLNQCSVLLGHGLNSDPRTMVAVAGELLAQGSRMTLFDVPAQGESSGCEPFRNGTAR